MELEIAFHQAKINQLKEEITTLENRLIDTKSDRDKAYKIIVRFWLWGENKSNDDITTLLKQAQNYLGIPDRIKEAPGGDK